MCGKTGKKYRYNIIYDKKIKKNKNNRAIFLEDVLSFCIYYLLYVYIYIFIYFFQII